MGSTRVSIPTKTGAGPGGLGWVLPCAALFVAGLGVSLYCGRLGFMPLDQSVMFDGGWRVLSGQAPFRDFSTLTGVTPLLLQAVFFRVFGVSWFAYCLHAAVFNGLFCALAYPLLRALPLGPGWAFFYALLSGLGFYPPIGTPYMEQHGFFFLLLAMAMLYCIRSARKSAYRDLLCLALPACLVLIFLSKQNVALFALLPLAATLGLFPSSARTLGRSAAFFALGCVLLAGALVGVCAWAGISWGSFFTEYVSIPMAVGGERTRGLWFVRAVFTSSSRLLTPGFILIATSAALFLLGVSRRSGAGAISWERLKPAAWKLLFAGSLMLFCVLFAQTTYKDPDEAAPFVFLALGALHSALAVEGASLGMPRYLLNWARIVLALVACRDAVIFGWLGATRQVNGIELRAESARPLKDPRLRFMVYQVPPVYGRIRAEDVDRLVGFLERAKGNFLLVGDFAILYGATGRPSVLPSLWYHVGIATPWFREKHLAAYEARLLENLNKYGVRYVVLEQEGTSLDIGLGNFPRLEKLVHERATEVRRFGGFRVLELDAGAVTQAPSP